MTLLQGASLLKVTAFLDPGAETGGGQGPRRFCPLRLKGCSPEAPTWAWLPPTPHHVSLCSALLPPCFRGCDLSPEGGLIGSASPARDHGSALECVVILEKKELRSFEDRRCCYSSFCFALKYLVLFIVD